MKTVKFFILFFLIFHAACSDYSPKPYGYFRIALKNPGYKLFTDSIAPYSFLQSGNTDIKFIKDTVEGNWFNIIYPEFNATIYCSYLSIHSQLKFNEIDDESKEFVSRHILKSNGVSTRIYTDPDHRIYATMYDIKGNAGSPVQFTITVSVHHFFRGALYFENALNKDSIDPVSDYIRKDIEEMITSFQWRK